MAKRWTDIRKAIRERLESLKDEKGEPRTVYWLAQELDKRGVMRPNSFYIYMRGAKDTSGKVLQAIFEVLGLELIEVDGGKGAKAKGG